MCIYLIYSILIYGYFVCVLGMAHLFSITFPAFSTSKTGFPSARSKACWKVIPKLCQNHGLAWLFMSGIGSWIVPLKWLCFHWESNSQLPGSHLGHFEAAFQSTLISIWRSWKAWDAHGHHPRMSGSPYAPSAILACSWMIEQSWSWW